MEIKETHVRRFDFSIQAAAARDGKPVSVRFDFSMDGEDEKEACATLLSALGAAHATLEEHLASL